MKIPFFDNFINKKVSEELNKELKSKAQILPWSKVPETHSYSPVLNEEPPAWKEEDYLKAAKSWVHSCVSTISDEIASINLKLYRVKGKDVEEVLEHELLDLLYKVNGFTTKFDHFWLTQSYLELTGEAPWLLDNEGGGKPTNIYLLRPDKVSIVFEKGEVTGYKYDVGLGKKVLLDKDSVIFLKYPNTLRPFRGKGTLEAVAQTVDLDNYSEKWNVNFFYNAARPDAILTTEQKLSEEQIKNLKNQWTKEFQGIGKRAKLAILEAGLDYKQMQLSQKDMDFLEQQKFSRDKILSIFRVPKPVVAITDDVNRANAESAAYSFARWTIKPKMRRIVDQLNEFLVPMYGDDLFLDFEDPVPENVEKKLKTYENALKNGWMTINEVRQEQNKPAVDGGDEIYLPMNLVSVGSVKPQKSVKLAPKIVKKNISKKDATEAIKEVIKSHIIKENGSKKTNVKEDVKEKFWRGQIKIQEALEKRFIEKIKILFENQRREVIRKLTKKDIDIPSVLLNVEDENRAFVITLSPIVKEVIKREGDLALGFVGVDESIDMASQSVISYLKKYPIKFSDSVNKTTNDKIRKQLREGLKEGEGTQKLAKRINTLFDNRKREKSLQIARTETARAMGFATEEAYVQSEVVRGKEWLTAFDERTCERCAAMNGRVVSLQKSFFKEGETFMGTEITYDDVDYPPLHVACRCSLIPVIGKTIHNERKKDIEEEIYDLMYPEKKAKDILNKIDNYGTGENK